MSTLANTVPDDKAVLRRKFKDLRRQFKSGEGRTAAGLLSLNLQKFLRDFSTAGVQVGLYRARRDEAPCALAPVSQFFYPVLEGNDIEFRRPNKGASFQTNALNFNEPIVEQSTPLDLTKPIIIFCPSLAIDSHGLRLGQGKGYYDRFLARHPQALRVGVVFHVQISSHPLPADSWDQAMDWIVSEKLILRTTSTRSS